MIVKLNNVRLAYPSLFTKAVIGNDVTNRYSGVLVIEKTQTELLAEINRALDEVIKKEFNGAPGRIERVLRDGDGGNNEALFGVYSLRGKNRNRPSVVDRGRHPITEADDIVTDGCYVNAIINITAYTSPDWGKQTSAELRGIQYIRPGNPFSAGGQVAAASDFDIISTDAENDADEFH